MGAKLHERHALSLSRRKPEHKAPYPDVSRGRCEASEKWQSLHSRPISRMPFALLLALFTALTSDAAPARPQPERAKPQRVRLDGGMPIFLRAFAAEHSRRLAEKRARTSVRAAECGGSGRTVISRPWNRNRKADRPGLITGRLAGAGGGALQGARVTIRPFQLVTRSAGDGSFQIAIPAQQLRTGDQLGVSVQAIGYRPHRTDLRVEAGDSAHLSVTLCRQTIRLTQVAAALPVARPRPAPQN
jgi:hypothetical protein